ncbi:MAG: glycosyltransferase [Opitutales bacterium]|nr:glycosyltransferase [Opitutales bacterium]
MKKKVIFITTSWGQGGTGPEIYARYLWEAFRDDPEIEFHLVASGSDSTHPRLHLIKPPEGSLALYRAVAEKGLALARSLGPSGILHVNSSNLHSCLLHSPWPVWGQINDYENTTVFSSAFKILKTYGIRRWFALLRRWWLERQFVNEQALTLCNSQFTQQNILAAYKPKHPERLKVLYKAVDTSQFERPAVLPANPHRVVDSRPVVLYVGSDFRRKGLDDLINVLLLIKTPLHLSIAGVTEQQFVKEFPELASTLNNKVHTIQFHGQTPREITKALFWHANLFCLPSRSEALGVAILEALAAGLPCVATSVGGIPEIAQQLGGCILVPSDSPPQLATAIKQAITRPPVVSKSVLSTSPFTVSAMTQSLRSLYLK